MATVDELSSKLRHMPPELLLEVERFVDALLARQAPPRSALAIVAEAPEQCVFHCAEELRAYNESERRSRQDEAV